MMKTWWAAESSLEEVTEVVGTDLVVVFSNSVSSSEVRGMQLCQNPEKSHLLASAFGKTGQLKLP